MKIEIIKGIEPKIDFNKEQDKKEYNFYVSDVGLTNSESKEESKVNLYDEIIDIYNKLDKIEGKEGLLIIINSLTLGILVGLLIRVILK